MLKQKYCLLLFALILVVSCEKKPLNYRNKYLGNWVFKVGRTEVNMDSIGYYHHDSVTYTGQINYGNGDDELLIKYTQDNSITLKIDKKDVLSNFPTPYCNGKFEGKNRIHLFLRWGGLGGGVTHTVDGEKK